MSIIHKTAQTALTKAAESMKHYVETHQQEAPEYKEGDKVWLEGKYVTTT